MLSVICILDSTRLVLAHFLYSPKNGSFLYLVISFSLRNGSAFLASITLTFFLDILTVCQKCNENGWKMNTACLELWEESLSTTFFQVGSGSRAIVVVAEKQQLSFLSFTAAPKLAAWMKPPSGHYTRDGQAGRFPSTPFFTANIRNTATVYLSLQK